MNATRTSGVGLAMAAILLVAGVWLWSRHAAAWDLGRSSPVLGYDAAQYALAARQLAEHGRLETLYALPVELALHPSPPWPLSLVQPGLVALEALLFRIAGSGPTHAPDGTPVSERRHWLALAAPMACYLATGIVLALACMGLLARHAPAASGLQRAVAGFVVGLAFLLDPEAQHFASGGFTELPFTLGLVLALVAVATGMAPRRPFVFGLLLGITGAFRGNMLWLAPLLAGSAAALSSPRRRLATFALAMAGYAIPLAPWWFYKWRAFGTAAWDLSWLSIWDGIEGRSWFSLNHLPELPVLPEGAAALGAIGRKVAGNIPALALALSTGPRGLWVGALLFWVFAVRPPRAVAVAALATLAVSAVSLVAAAASVPLLRYVFPSRVALEAAGVLALWGLVARTPSPLVGAGARRALAAGVAVLALGWGALQTSRGWSEARAVASGRGVPSTAAVLELVAEIDREVPAGEPVMSNLGPILAWFARRPVVHLALTPADVDACRRRLDLRHVLLVFREPSRAWPAWEPVMERPEEAQHEPEWNVRRARRFQTRDGFSVVWLELGPLDPGLAGEEEGLPGPWEPGRRSSRDHDRSADHVCEHRPLSRTARP